MVSAGEPDGVEANRLGRGDVACHNFGSGCHCPKTSPNHKYLQENHTIHLTVKGSPISNSLWQYATINPPGKIYFHWKVK